MGAAAVVDGRQQLVWAWKLTAVVPAADRPTRVQSAADKQANLVRSTFTESYYHVCVLSEFRTSAHPFVFMPAGLGVPSPHSRVAPDASEMMPLLLCASERRVGRC